MTTPANDEKKDEKKKDDTPVSASIITPKSGGTTSDAPLNSTSKKRKRKRKPKKSEPYMETPVSATKEASTEEKKHAGFLTSPTQKATHSTTSHKKTDHTTVHHTKKEKKEKEKDKEQESMVEINKKPNLDIKSDDHMLPGIDNIHEYIARKKASTLAHEKKEGAVSFITPDGTDLLSLSGLYGLVPHAKGDHKLVYLSTNMPEGLVDDPRKRTPGTMYVKNGRDIYMVTLTMKEHPTLKDSHGEAYDVWIIDSPEQLNQQIEAIKNGMGGGENFGEVVLLQNNTVEIKKPDDSIDTQKDATPGVTDSEELIVLPEVDESNFLSESEVKEKTEQVIEEVVPLTEDNPSEDIPTVDIDIDTQDGNIDSIDLTLPADEQSPDIDLVLTESSISENLNEQEMSEIEESSDEITLDMEEPLESVDTILHEQQSKEEAEPDLPDEQQEQEGSSEEITLDMEESEELQPIEPSILEETPQNVHQEDVGYSDEITLDMEETQTREHSNEESMLHFNTPDALQEPQQEETDLGNESGGHSLFGSSQEEPTSGDNPDAEVRTGSSMFRQPDTTPSVITSQEDTTNLGEGDESPKFSSLQDTPMSGTTTTKDEANTTPPSETILPSSSLDLDDLSIEPANGTIDLDNMPTSTSSSPMATTSVVFPNTSSHESLKETKQSSFPIYIIIRIVLFLLIAGALVLVWKIMFPTIKGTKLVDDTQVNTGQVYDDIPNSGDSILPDTTGSDTAIPLDNLDPEDDTPPIEDNIPTIDDTTPTLDDTIDTPPQALTINELTEKLKLQQTEARKILNIAKLLENKQAIKFSLAAMLKAGNILERIDIETTITADDVLLESQKIDRYLMEANKLVE